MRKAKIVTIFFFFKGKIRNKKRLEQERLGWAGVMQRLGVERRRGKDKMVGGCVGRQN